MRKITDNQQLMINLGASITVFLVNAAINFFLSPYITNTLGAEANGFVQLATNFVSYVSIIMMALNSMSSRFMTVAYHSNQEQKMKEYYSSTFAGNIILILILLIPISLGIVFLEDIIQISPELIIQVKSLFALVFINYFISTGLPNWDVAFFATNKIYLQSFGIMLSYIARAASLVILFGFFDTQIWYVGLAALLATVVLRIWMYIGMRQEFPDIRFRKKYIKFKAIKELVTSGIWNALSQLGFTLTNGLNLLITNLFISAHAMGIVSLALVVPTVITALQLAVSNTFAASLTILYAKKEIDRMVTEIFKAGKLTLIIIGLPLAGFIAFGKPFFEIWVPNQDAVLLQVLSVVTMINLVFINGSQPLWQIFVVVNKNKPGAISVLISGVANIVLTFIALKTTNFGVYAVVGISSFISVIRYLAFIIPYSAIYLKLKWYRFYPLVAYSILTLIINLAIGWGITQFISIHSWTTLFLAAIIFVIIAGPVSSIVVLNKSEKKFVLTLIKSRLP